MVLSKILFIVLLDFLALSTALRSSYVSRNQFQSIVHENEVVLVAFLAPWTEASKALEPEWLSATSQSKKPLIRIDCTIESELCQENGVISYPAIRLFKGVDNVTRYRGPRKASAIVSFINLSTIPIISTLDEKNITAFKSTSEAVFIAYLTSQDTDIMSTFTDLASRNHHRFAFGIASDPSLAKAGNIPVPSLVCYKAWEGEQEILSGQLGIEALEKFMETATTHPIGEMTRRNEMRYLKAGKSLIYIFTLTESERSAYRASLKPLAKKYQEYLNFVTIDAVEYAYMAPMLGLEAGAFPALAVQNPMLGQVFPYDQQRRITAEAVESFILDIVQGRVQPSTGGAERQGSAHDEL